jgi:PAS domain-containing protein
MSDPGPEQRIVELEEELARLKWDSGARELSPALFQHILGTMSEAVLVTDQEGRLTYVSPNVKAVLGIDLEEALARGSIDQLLGPVPLAGKALRDPNGPLELEIGIRDGDNQDRVLQVKASRIDQGGPALLFTCWDRTGTWKNEEKIKALTRFLDAVKPKQNSGSSSFRCRGGRRG